MGLPPMMQVICSKRTALLLARVGSCDASVIKAREVLELATIGGAKVLGRDDIGYLPLACPQISLQLTLTASSREHTMT